MDIEMAAMELYSTISQIREVIGFGVSQLKEKKIIVIYLSQKNISLSEKIPQTYKGFSVIIEVTGEITLQ